MARMTREPASPSARYDALLAVILFLAITLSLSAIVWMLNRTPTAQTLTIIGGLSGASAALIALMLRAAQTPEATANIRSRRISAVFTYPAGFLAGAFSLLASLATLGLNVSNASMPGAAMLGGLYGLVLGAYWAKAVESAAASDTLLAPSVSALESRFTTPASTRTNWSGDVVISADGAKGDVVVGEIRVRFEPKLLPKPGYNGPRREAREKSAVALSRTPLRIEDGNDGTHAEFVITVSGGSGRSAFPRRQVARVPTDKVSPEYLFKLITDDMDRDAPRHGEEQIEERSINTSGPILVDISMAGRTVQVVETHLTWPEQRP
ncbi:hypothetical protein [Rhodococcus sp. IEGM 1307]|uniref:hypothetical protein n=1 Tax=Rhodococcus sp. IEGM 1307 TaxID=3047091 RepID=UPI0024B7519A|nr:hypothetical protein [Rhodococcus sp. IEGM 1307]MDI9978808.1 hypothetical protein [Rhodococcus sp. IEGM 1307]